MKEELFIIKNGQRVAVDLCQPSGISLCFNSNLFADLSKIDCSHSYTFKLPATANNARAFDLVGDIRHASALYGCKIPAEYWCDGVPIAAEANLYISEVNNGVYSAVLTFGFIAALQAMADDDAPIASLGDTTAPETTTYGWDTSTRNAGSLGEYCDAENFDNAVVQTPLYSAGVPIFRDNSEAFYRLGDDENAVYQRPLPPPVVPLHAILRKIEAKYGLTLDFLQAYDYDDWAADIAQGKTPPFLAVAGIPLVTTALSEQYEEQQNIELRNVTGFADETFTFTDRDGTQHEVTLEHALDFSSYVYSVQMDFLELYDAHHPNFIKTKMQRVSLRVGGSLYVSYNEASELDEPPHLRVVMLNGRGETELVDVEGQYDEENSSSGNQVYFWEFRETEGFTPQECDVTPIKGNPIGFAISDVPDSVISGTLVISPHFEEGVMGHTVRVYECLPEISCFALLKSLFYVLGGFPRVGAGGAIGITRFTELRDNLAAGDVYDWTGYAVVDFGADPATLKYTNGNLGIKNYLLMKNESVEQQETSKTEDLYDAPAFALHCDNATLEKAKTLHQFPFYGRFIRNGQHHSLSTGDTIKYWSVDRNIASASEAKPALGTFGIDGTTGLLTFSVWQAGEQSDEYAYLQTIVENPYVVKIPVRVPMTALVAINYAKPVYIGQLNAYFAIMSVTTDAAGRGTAELIKLP